MKWKEVADSVPLWRFTEMVEKVTEERGETPTLDETAPDWVTYEVETFWRNTNGSNIKQ